MRLNFLTTHCQFFNLARTCLGPVKRNEKPNFIFILVDVPGWADPGSYVSFFHETPNIDRLAGETRNLAGMFPERVGDRLGLLQSRQQEVIARFTDPYPMYDPNYHAVNYIRNQP